MHAITIKSEYESTIEQLMSQKIIIEDDLVNENALMIKNLADIEVANNAKLFFENQLKIVDLVNQKNDLEGELKQVIDKNTSMIKNLTDGKAVDNAKLLDEVTSMIKNLTDGKAVDNAKLFFESAYQKIVDLVNQKNDLEGELKQVIDKNTSMIKNLADIKVDNNTKLFFESAYQKIVDLVNQKYDLEGELKQAIDKNISMIKSLTDGKAVDNAKLFDVTSMIKSLADIEVANNTKLFFEGQLKIVDLVNQRYDLEDELKQAIDKNILMIEEGANQKYNSEGKLQNTNELQKAINKKAAIENRLKQGENEYIRDAKINLCKSKKNIAQHNLTIRLARFRLSKNKIIIDEKKSKITDLEIKRDKILEQLGGQVYMNTLGNTQNDSKTPLSATKPLSGEELSESRKVRSKLRKPVGDKNDIEVENYYHLKPHTATEHHYSELGAVAEGHCLDGDFTSVGGASEGDYEEVGSGGDKHHSALMRVVLKAQEKMKKGVIKAQEKMKKSASEGDKIYETVYTSNSSVNYSAISMEKRGRHLSKKKKKERSCSER